MNEKTASEHGSDFKVSDKWKAKFEALDRVGAGDKFIYVAMQSPEYKALGFKEKMQISFNVWAFVFGPFYYFSKKMWHKGAVILAGAWVIGAILTLIELAVGSSLPDVIYWIPVAVIASQLANYDYYRFVKNGEKMWEGLPDFFSRVSGAIGIPLAALVLLGGVTMVSPAYVEESKTLMLEEVGGVWRANSDGAMVEIDLSDRAKMVTINGREIPVTVQSIDLENNIVSLGVSLGNGRTVSWSLRQIIDEDDSFTLHMTLHDGTQDGLSFIRNL